MRNFNSFNDYYNILKVQITRLCKELDKSTNFRIEYNDLFQEASLKLFDIYKNDRPLDINYSLKAVRNHLIDYIKHEKRNPLSEAISIEDLESFNPQNY